MIYGFLQDVPYLDLCSHPQSLGFSNQDDDADASDDISLHSNDSTQVRSCHCSESTQVRSCHSDDSTQVRN
jgi:hypothetical protein